MRTLLFSLLAPVALGAQAPVVTRINVTPSPARVLAGETLQLKAQAVDADGKVVPGVLIRFQQTAANFEGTVDSTGLVSAGAVSTIPIVVAAIVHGAKPVIKRIEVTVLPGPAATLELAPLAAKLVPKQSLTLSAGVLSKAGDRRDDAVSWTSSAPAVAQVGRDGSVMALTPGSANRRAE